MKKEKLILKNTLFLYFRQFLLLIISLFSVRILLQALGTEDYGIFNVVAGVITMFSFLSMAMATASQRYFSFYLGKHEYDYLNKIFNTTFEIYLLIIILIIIIAETFGLWFVNNKLVIPNNRIIAANILYQFTVIQFVFTILVSPYMACIIAHEEMNLYAYVSIVEALFKLVIVFLLKILNFDGLVLYGLFLSIASFLVFIIYMFYCSKHFSECKIKFCFESKIFYELCSYSGWNLFGCLVVVVRNQITNILINLYFGPVINAAKALSNQVSYTITSFGQNFTTAMRPQIIKTYANNEIEECLNLVYKGCKITFFLMYIFSLPLFMEMDFVFKIWLGNLPEYTVLFTRIMLIDVLFDCLNYQIMTYVHANGDLKLYSIVVGIVLLLNFPISLVALKLGAPAYAVLVISLILTFLAMIVRLFIVKHIAVFSICNFLRKVILPCLLITVISFGTTYCLYKVISNEIVRFFCVVIFSVIINVLLILLFGLNKNERHLIFTKINYLIGRKI